MPKFLLFLLALLLSIPVALLRGVVLQDLVDWFTPWHIGVVQGIGLTYIVGMFTYWVARTPLKNNATGEEFTGIARLFQVLIHSVLYSLIAWLFGWLWSFFL